MCQYLSFCGDLEGNEFWFDLSLMSHSATAERHKLKPDTYREFEWIGPDADSLTVRVHHDDKRDAAYLRACVLAKWPDRKSLEDWLIANVEGCKIAQRLAKGGDRSTLTGGYRSTLTGGDESTLTGGDRSTLTGGDRSTLTGGYESTLTGGYGSTLTGGYESLVSFWFYDGDKYIRVVGVIGRDGLEPGVVFHAVDGKIVAIPKE